MRLAIMQPYFFPYIGYFQLLGAVDLFIVYDNIKYTKKGWINRNRMLRNGEATVFSLPLKGAPDHLEVCQRQVADDFNAAKLLNQFENAYHRAPCHEATLTLLSEGCGQPAENLFDALNRGIKKTCENLNLQTPIRPSSSIAIDHALKGQDKVLALCEAVGADTYINAIGGLELYSREDFAKRGIKLHFLRSQSVEYPQFGAPFVPWLSILDVLMFNPANTVSTWANTRYDLI